ncbi:MAG: hypothetical protein IKQ91_05085 [Oscillospiraceae bacterium]|nr:hypothetical protein [Oscillospiraceae bacterium]
MKKTLKTVMTSAMFAAALGITAGNAPVSAAETADVPDVLPTEESLMERTAETMVCVYGPPEYFTEPEQTGTTVTDAALRDEDETMTGTEPLRPAGVAPVITETEPPEEIVLPGEVPLPVTDWNSDGKMSAADLSYMKRMLLEGDSYYYRYEGDLNYDGRFDKEDIKALRRMLTGKSKEEEDAEEAAKQTSAPVMTSLKTTETTTIFDIPQPAYGPPEWFEQQ